MGSSSKAKRYDAEFKLKVVLALLRNEVSQGELSRRYHISMMTLSKWKEAFIQSGMKGLKGDASSDKKKIEKLEKEIRKRDQIIGELTVANKLLKKVSFWTKALSGFLS